MDCLELLHRGLVRTHTIFHFWFPDYYSKTIFKTIDRRRLNFISAYSVELHPCKRWMTSWKTGRRGSSPHIGPQPKWLCRFTRLRPSASFAFLRGYTNFLVAPLTHAIPNYVELANQLYVTEANKIKRQASNSVVFFNYAFLRENFRIYSEEL